MKKHIQNIELVNQFFNNELSNSEKEAFNQKLRLDSEFKILFDEQLQFLEGIKRYILKGEIKKGHRVYKRNKLLKMLGITLLAISLVIIIPYLVNESSGTITTDKPIKETFSVGSSNTFEKNTLPVVEVKTIKPIFNANRPNTDASKQTSISEVLIAPDDQKNTTEIEQLYSSLKKQPEVFQINSEKDTIITCKEGTLLTIKANSFIDSKTKQIIKGNLKLKVTEYYNLSDIITANLTTLADDAILETGGMLYIEVSQNSNRCKLSKINTLQIGFPFKQHKKDMQLFTGEKNQELVNWKLVNNEQILVAKTPTESAVVAIFGSSFDSEENDSIFNSNVEKKILANDKFQKGLNYNSDNSNKSITKRDITRYLFNASKLGWINCDRFINNKKTKVKFKIKVGKGADIDVKMIFKNFKAVLPGNFENENYNFKKVPIDEPVVIYAIKYENGQYYMALQNTITSSKNTSLIFEKVSLLRLKENIKALKHF
jgi:hypothetical protein